MDFGRSLTAVNDVLVTITETETRTFFCKTSIYCSSGIPTLYSSGFYLQFSLITARCGLNHIMSKHGNIVLSVETTGAALHENNEATAKSTSQDGGMAVNFG